MIATLAVTVCVAALLSIVVKPTRARAFDLFYGSMAINDSNGPIMVDLASGRPSVRLVNAPSRVGATSIRGLMALPLAGGTLLLNTQTGEFNMIDQTGFVTKTADGGVRLPPVTVPTTPRALAAGSSAYLAQVGANESNIYLVTVSTLLTANDSKNHQGSSRAYATIPATIANDAGAMTSANGDLWLLAGAGSRTIEHLHFDPASKLGSALTPSSFGTVAGVAAIGSTGGVAATSSSTQANDAVAVATASTVRVFTGDGKTYQHTISVPPGTVRILAATGQQSSLSFLYQSARGWSIVSAAADGSSANVASIGGISASDELATPAQSNGMLYTMSSNNDYGLWRIGRTGHAERVPGMGQYPFVNNESKKVTDAAVLTRGNRVIYNSPTSLQAVTVFTDGSHPPVTIDKSAAVSLNASGGVDALTALHNSNKINKAPQKSKEKSTTPPKPAEPLNDTIDCKATTQVPHIPLVETVAVRADQVQLKWIYPLLSPQDCAPSTYTVSVRAIDSDTPAPPGLFTVQGQTGAIVAGLHPDSKYAITVTAFINGIGTPSTELPVRTSPKGPDAPTNLQVASHGDGNWDLTWDPCTVPTCVAAASWQVIASLCAGPQLSLADQPPTQTTSMPAPHWKYAGTSGLLGQSLRFSVVGISETGRSGGTSAPSGCVQSWSAPLSSALTLSASVVKDATSADGTGQATVTLGTTGDPITAIGGVGAHVSYSLVSAGLPTLTAEPKTLSSTGSDTATISGIQPGHAYTASAIVTPPGPSSGVKVGPVPMANYALPWPTISATADFSNVNGATAQGTLLLTISGVSSTGANGQRFALGSGSYLRCSLGTGGAQPLTAMDFDPAQPVSLPIDRTVGYGDCTVTVSLRQDNTGSNPYYNTPSSNPSSESPVTISAPTLDPGTWSATWDGADDGVISVVHSGGSALSNSLSANWSFTVLPTDTSGGSCGSASSPDPASGPPATVTVSRNCLSGPTAPNPANWQVKISFTYAGSSQATVVTVSGAVPTPAPSVTDFTATWGSSLDAGGNAVLTVSYVGKASKDQLNARPWTAQPDGILPTGTPPAPTACAAPTAWTANSTQLSVALDCARVSNNVVVSTSAGGRQSVTIPITGTVPAQ